MSTGLARRAIRAAIGAGIVALLLALLTSMTLREVGYVFLVALVVIEVAYQIEVALTAEDIESVSLPVLAFLMFTALFLLALVELIYQVRDLLRVGWRWSR